MFTPTVVQIWAGRCRGGLRVADEAGSRRTSQDTTPSLPGIQRAFSLDLVTEILLRIGISKSDMTLFGMNLY